MIDLLKRVYYSKESLLLLFGITFGIVASLASLMTIDMWLASTKFIGLYLNTIYFLLIIKRVKLFKSIKVYMHVRLTDIAYTKFLITSLGIHCVLYLLVVYGSILIFHVGNLNSASVFFYIFWYCRDSNIFKWVACINYHIFW